MSVAIRSEPVERCPLCTASRFEVVLRAPDHDAGTGWYSVARCLACGLQFTTPRPVEADLPLLYADRTFDALPTADSAAAALRRWRARARLHGLAPWLPSGPLRVAEVGVGDGLFASVVARAPRVVGVDATDFFDDPPPLLRKVAGVRYTGYDTFFAGETRYDVIFARFVLEHVRDPVAFVDALDRRLEPGGLLVVDVPNAASIWRRLFGPASGRAHHLCLSFAELRVNGSHGHVPPEAQGERIRATLLEGPRSAQSGDV